MAVFGYTRVSTESQISGNGLDVQANAIKAYAAEHGYKLEKIFTDAGVSGTKETRPALDELLLETIAEGDIILVHTTSRLWRSIFAQATVMKAVMNAKAEIVSIDEPAFNVYKYMTDPENYMITGMLSMLDTWERMTVTRKLARGRQQKAEKGNKPAGALPLGYCYSSDKRTVEVDEKEAEIVKTIFREALRGASLQEIANKINTSGARTRRGLEFSKGSVSLILNNRFYIGELQYAGEVIQGNHTPLVSKVTFGKCQAALKRRKRG